MVCSGVGWKLKIMPQLMIFARFCFKNAVTPSDLVKERYTEEDILLN